MSVKGPLLALGILLIELLGRALAAELVPPGIGVRLTIAGPTFVDAQGMTLYTNGNNAGAGYCPDHPETVRPSAEIEEFPMQVPDAATRRSCVEKYPPLVAPVDAAPVGHWTIHVRENGTRQWAYRGRPLHRSIKDQAPGDIHAWIPTSQGDAVQPRTPWEIARAPLEAPSGIETRLTFRGLVLTNHQGKTLYFANRDDDKTVQTEDWKPLLVPAAAKANSLPADWSIADYKGGLHQWAWKGKALYTYAQDNGDLRATDDPPSQFVDIFGGYYGQPITGWRAALLKPASAPPVNARVKTVFRGPEKIYADAQGTTLYAIYCAEATRDRLDCDDIGDSPRYWLSFCGGEKRCGNEWRPFLAPDDAAAIDGVWSVSAIDSSHPFKPLKDGEQGIRVWTYRGRPVFTFAEDESLYDLNGEFDPVSTGMWARSIEAFGDP